MNRIDFLNLFAYSDTCWRLLGDSLVAVPDAWKDEFETTSRFNSIARLLAHCVGAEERLVGRRLQNLPIEIPYEDRAAADWTGVYADHCQIRAATYAYLETLSDDDFVDPQPILPPTPERGALTRADILFQVLNHENFHRGQVILILQRIGGDPPNFDYMALRPKVDMAHSGD